MPEHEPTTQTVNASQVRKDWSQVINQVFRGETRVIVEKSGIPVAAIISAADLERLRQLEAAERPRLAALERTWAAFAAVPPEEIEQEVARAVGRARQAGPAREGGAPGAAA